MSLTEGHLELISHPLCSFNQRLVILLLLKGQRLGADFTVRYVSLAHLPEWFHALSPHGAMPVLALTGVQCLSTHACTTAEFLDEVTPPQLHPTDPVRRLRHRHWIVAADAILGKLRGVFAASHEADIDLALDEIFQALSDLESELHETAAWFDEQASIVDAAFAPLFCLLLHFRALADDCRWAPVPRVRAWAEYLLQQPSVQASKAPDYVDEFNKFFTLFDSAFQTRAAA